MATTEHGLHFPLDEGGFLRRECPFCKREFKVLVTAEERKAPTESIRQLFLTSDQDQWSLGDEGESPEYHCPYCGQIGSRDSWWTEQQVEYINAVLRNIAAQLLNENLIRPLKRSLGRPQSSPVSITFEGREIEQHEERIAPEPEDMTRFPLPCCERAIKISDDWSGPVYCFFCGFPHEGPGRANELAR